ncbi:Pycsar system effector family protein [Mycolicibacterium brisbanense]|uniref:Pycsar effector protein domain-containing protein n=1 Tax=Mycolicibacterium brisbanense TaxID=146020 RepID=A0A117I4C0_9MYCO|nr:Pycsar system effector family protein [Mycolicibacterium brisbanense]MCV7157453.1 hypothetical protein [Mycolicibacterium brisbanense]GAS86717.1 uncharacterized protein RMCB_0813 [Mycolicibacterium brisbanense]
MPTHSSSDDSDFVDPVNPSLDAAEAWKAVSLVNDWVKHAETKSAGVLAASGVVGGVLYNLVKSRSDFDCWIRFGAMTCGVLAVASAICAGIALWPRLAPKEQPTSVFYFDHIARRHPNGPDAYIQELKGVLAEPDELLSQLGQQVWANARVARHKYRWAGRALVALLGATAALAVVALDLAAQSTSVR